MVVFSVADTDFLIFCFDASRVCRVEKADYLMVKWKSHVAAFSCISIASHAILKLQKIPMIEIGLEES